MFPTLVTPHEKYFKQRSWQFHTIGYACCMVLEYFAALKKAATKVTTYDEGEERKLTVEKHEEKDLTLCYDVPCGLKKWVFVQFNS